MQTVEPLQPRTGSYRNLPPKIRANCNNLWRSEVGNGYIDANFSSFEGFFMSWITTQIESLRGQFRLERVPADKRVKSNDIRAKGPRLSSDNDSHSQDIKQESAIAEARKLIPGEVLVVYISLLPITDTAANPGDAKIILALIFTALTIISRWIGSQKTGNSAKSKTQFGVVAISTLSFISLVYSMGGQIWWHSPIPDQKIYAQFFAGALGVLGPQIFYKVFKGN